MELASYRINPICLRGDTLVRKNINQSLIALIADKSADKNLEEVL